MPDTLSQLFEGVEKGVPIRYGGRDLYRAYRLEVREGDTLSIRFLKNVDRPVQGIGLKCHKCKLQVAGTEAANLALWVDTAPPTVVVRIAKAKPGATVLVSNLWRDEKHGTTMYYINNAAMDVVAQPDGSLLFRCSDGWLGPDFGDLVFLAALIKVQTP